MFINAQNPRNRGLKYWLYPMPSRWSGPEWFGPRGVGTITGTATRGLNYLDFDGSTNYVTITKPNQSAPFSRFTVIVDVLVDAWGSLDTLISRGQLGAPFSNFEIRRHISSQFWQGAVGVGGTSYTVDTGTITTGVRHTVAITYDTETLSIYVNGGSKVSNTTPSGNAIDTAGDIRLGENLDFPGRWFDGRIYSVKVFDVALSDDDINRDYHDSLMGYPGYFAPQNDMNFCLRLRKAPSSNNFVIF